MDDRFRPLGANQAEGICAVCGFAKVYTGNGSFSAAMVASAAIAVHRRREHGEVAQRTTFTPDERATARQASRAHARLCLETKDAAKKERARVTAARKRAEKKAKAADVGERVAA